MFVTVWLGYLEISTGKLTWADAGHEPLMLLQDGSWKKLSRAGGIALGFLEPEFLEENPPFRNQELVSGPVNPYVAAENLSNVLAAQELAARGDAGEPITNGAFRARAEQLRTDPAFLRLAERYTEDPTFRRRMNREMGGESGAAALQEAYQRAAAPEKIRGTERQEAQPEAQPERNLDEQPVLRPGAGSRPSGEAPYPGQHRMIPTVRSAHRDYAVLFWFSDLPLPLIAAAAHFADLHEEVCSDLAVLARHSAGTGE